MSFIYAMAHNGQICKEIERLLNELIRSVKKNDGMIWLQSKSNKDDFYELTDEVIIGFISYIVDPEADKDNAELDEFLYPAERDESYKEYKEKILTQAELEHVLGIKSSESINLKGKEI